MKRWRSAGHFVNPSDIGAWLDLLEQEVERLTVVSVTGSGDVGWLVVVSFFEEDRRQATGDRAAKSKEGEESDG